MLLSQDFSHKLEDHEQDTATRAQTQNLGDKALVESADAEEKVGCVREEKKEERERIRTGKMPCDESESEREKEREQWSQKERAKKKNATARAASTKQTS